MWLRSDYQEGERIPDRYANHGVVGGENVSLPFEWGERPEGTQSYALSIIDHHPVANEFVHWLVVDITIETNEVPAGASMTTEMPAGAKELATGYRKAGYGGPKPPKGTGDHDYEAVIYALGVERLGLDENDDISRFEAAIEGKVLDRARLTGFYSQ